MTTDLIVSESLNPIAVFATEGGVNSVLDDIKAKAAAFVPDISTDAGRKEVASFAYKIARSKTLLDDMGKGLVAQWKAKSAAVDAERKRVRDELDALKDEVRKPLTEWENAEKSRVAQHEADIDLLNRQAQFDTEPDSATIQSRMHDVAAFHASKDWQEFQLRAQTAKDAVLSDLEKRLETRKAFEEQQAELERLQREEAERKQREHEERLKAEAAEKARQEVKEKARREREEAEAAAKAEQDRLAAAARADEEREAKAKADAEAAEKVHVEAEVRAKQAELSRIVAENKARADAEEAKRQADERARQEAEAAAQRERDKIAAEKKAEEAATARREADKQHKAKINSEALATLVEAGLTEDAAKLAVTAIAQGKVQHVRIAY